jgi:hypothetical protein
VAILAGAFLANVATAGSAVTSLAIAAENVFEGLFGAYLTERFAAGRRAFDRPPVAGSIARRAAWASG